jgi:hypothetical protein
MRRLFSAVLLSTLLIGFAPGGLQAQSHGPEVGRVIVAIGQFSALQPGGEVRALTRRSPVYNGDTLVTGKDTRAQVRFGDDSLVALRPDSQFRVDDFQFDGSADGDENAAFTLLKGGMRTITGVIGKQNREKYQVRTDVATIGVRGTHYVLQRCAGDCGPRGAGLYGGVVQGAIVVNNDSGATVIDTEQFFHVSDAGSGPQLLLAPPELLFSGEEQEVETAPAPEEGGQSEEGSGGTGGTSAAPQASADAGEVGSGPTADDSFGSDAELAAPSAPLPSLTETTTSSSTDIILDTGTDLIEPAPDSTETVAPYPSAPDGAVMAVGMVSLQSAGDYDAGGGAFRQGEGTADGTTDIQLGSVDAATNIPMAAEVYLPDHTETIGGVTTVVPGCSPCTLSVGQSTLQDAGGLGGVGTALNWGRWEGDVVVGDNGTTSSPIGGLHYIYSPNETPYSTVTSMTGNYYYSLAGGTAPTDEQGVAGALNSASISVDFSTQTLSSAFLDGNVNGKSFSAYSSTSVPLADLYQPDNGIEMSGSCYGGACGTSMAINGRMSANFVGPNAERIIGVYGLEQDAAGASPIGITGTVALER